MFWSRGNAWVMAGLVRILEFLPQNDPDRPEFLSLVQNMAAALDPLQRPDGSTTRQNEIIIVRNFNEKNLSVVRWRWKSTLLGLLVI